MPQPDSQSNPQQPSPQINPLVQRYLDQLTAALAGRGVSPEEQAGIRADIESHVAEATSRGERLADVLERLGSADRLAGAYAVEELLRPRWARGADRRRVQAVAGSVVAVVTATTAALLGVLLGLAGAALALGGVVGALAAIAAPLLPLDPTLRAGWPQLVVVLVSLALAAAGVAILRLARWNLGVLRNRGLRMKHLQTTETERGRHAS
jgi:uncharacterized membrane protein